jgi:predicted nucleotidyltransferase component of viral defense system
MKETKFYPQVLLLLDILPYVAKEKCFALKGGTAINLFVRNFPRLSVDIDITYLGDESRDEALEKMEQALHRIQIEITKHIGANVTPSSRQSQASDVKLYIDKDGVQVKIEANPVIRGVVYPVETRSLQPKVEDEFNREIEIQVTSLPDLYGGKIAAALDRQHPRDLFDIKLLMDHEGLTPEITTSFLVYLMCHKRPPNELLKPTLKDQKHLFNSEFAGMTNIEFSYAEFESTRKLLAKEINNKITNSHKQFLISFFENKPNWDLFSEPNVQNLPAIKWKMFNLSKMTAEKLQAQANHLKNIFK